MGTSVARVSALASLSAVVLAALYLLLLAPGERSVITPSGGNPYHILGVPRDADREAVVKAYRALAKRWHPDRNGGNKEAEAVFSTVAHAYDVLLSPEKREVFDRLGETGLERLRDGDPSVHKDWLPPDEVLRRIHNDGDEGWLEYAVTSSFASLASLLSAWDRRMAPTVRWLTGTEFPSVVITATKASGAALRSGGRASETVTFRFTLSGKSLDFDERAVVHNCPRSKFLGMKTTFYLQCEHDPGLALSVSVAANTFTTTNRHGSNTAAEPFLLDMT